MDEETEVSEDLKTTSITEHHPCEVCCKPCKAFCQKCGKVHYCSREHQVLNWKTHKAVCFPFETRLVKVDGVEGRYMVATRDIVAGEKLLKEKAAIIGPKAKYLYDRVCLGCCNRINTALPGPIYRCSSCGWALCSSECEQGKLHSELECQLFTQSKVPSSELEKCDAVILYDCVTVLRILLLKETDAVAYNTIMKTVLEQNANNLMPKEQSFHFSEASRTIIRNFFGIELGVEDSTLDQLICAVKSNSLATLDRLPDEKSKTYLSIFFMHTSLNPSSCVSNFRWSLEMYSSPTTGNYAITSVACVDIKKGQLLNPELTHLFAGTQVRRNTLYMEFSRVCRCHRCTDPTELGTNFSTLLCTKLNCSRGLYLHEEPLSKEPRFKCTGCGHTIQSGVALDIGKRFGTTTTEAFAKFMKDGQDEVYINTLEKLAKNESKVLHPNHYLLQSARYAICERFLHLATEMGTGSVKVSLAEKVATHCKACLDAINSFFPGQTRIRGRLLYTLQLCLNSILSGGKHQCNRSKMSSAVLRFKKKKFEELIRIQKECYEILQLEPEFTDESIMRAYLKAQMTSTQELADYLTTRRI